MADFAAQLIDPTQIDPGGELGPYPFDLFDQRFLAQGDSWFSVGSIPPGLTSNILAELTLPKSTVIVNCARPGKLLVHMTDSVNAPTFTRLLAGKRPFDYRWDAILVSGGGNDVIDAAGIPPGPDPSMRLLATEAERSAGGPPPSDAQARGAYYISEPGWQVLARHLSAVFDGLVETRDGGVNKGVPLYLHTYSYLMPRPAEAGFGFGPWLEPAMNAFAVPADDRLALATALLDRLAELLGSLIAKRQAIDPSCTLHLIDTRLAGLALADAAATAQSGDFINEIHPTRLGYAKLTSARGNEFAA